MSALLHDFRRGHDGIVIRTIHVAFALSLVLHALLMVGWLPKIHLTPAEDLTPGKSSGSLAVRLAPLPSMAHSQPSSPPPAPAIPPQPAPTQKPPAPRASKAPPPERVLAIERPSPSRAIAPPPEPSKALIGQDLAAFVEARRRSREVPPATPSQPSPPAPPAETEQERVNRAAAANLGLNRTPTFGSEKERGGGIFQIARIGFNDAEFFFFGWNKAIRRNARQMIEVQRGSNPSTELAVVRRMIVIIREHEQNDFVWESQRLGRDVNLSARQADNAGLEDFLMREFFPAYRSRP